MSNNNLVKRNRKIAKNGNACFKIVVPKILFNKGFIKEKKYRYNVYFDYDTEIISYVPVTKEKKEIDN